jgi:hypothetical protein
VVRNLKEYTDKKFPQLGDTLSENVREMTALLKMELTGTDKAWYVVEYDGTDKCFGFFVDETIEPMYFSLGELNQELNQLETSKHKIKIDPNFEQITISKILVDFWYEEWGL